MMLQVKTEPCRVEEEAECPQHWQLCAQDTCIDRWPDYTHHIPYTVIYPSYTNIYPSYTIIYPSYTNIYRSYTQHIHVIYPSYPRNIQLIVHYTL